MAFGNKKAIISVVGKRCAISGVPNFLDDSLHPWREKLHQAAFGKASLQEAIEARALQEILSLSVAGKGRVEEVRRLYPFGLSVDAINAILKDTRLAINRTTLTTRTVIAVLCVAACFTSFYLVFTSGTEQRLTAGWSRWQEMVADSTFLVTAIGASWALLNFSTRFVLKKRFPQMQLALQQKIGKTGYSMLGGIIAVFAVCIWLSPIKPLWLAGPFH
jgi:hypothetical protein